MELVGTGSEVFGKQISALVNALPASAKRILVENKVPIKAAHHVTEINPILEGVTPRGWNENMTWDAAEGFYANEEGYVAIAEKVKYGRDADWVTGRSAKNILPHEIGHAIDYASDNYSRSDTFKAAYKLDIAKIKKDGDTEKYPYFTQPGDAGREETFAELFAETVGSEGCNQKSIKAAFPNTNAAVAKFLED